MKPRTQEEVYAPALEKARRELRNADPWLVAFKSATFFREAESAGQEPEEAHEWPPGRWEVRFWGRDYTVDYPHIKVLEGDSGKEPSWLVQLLILHYLLHSDGTPPAERWVSFRELPGGLGYDPVFRARTSLRLVRAFGQDVEGLCRAARALGGERLSFGDASFLFRMFPRLWLAVVFYRGDEEFSPSANVLFDASAAHYLPTEDLVVLGEFLCKRLVEEGTSAGG